MEMPMIQKHIYWFWGIPDWPFLFLITTQSLFWVLHFGEGRLEESSKPGHKLCEKCTVSILVWGCSLRTGILGLQQYTELKLLSESKFCWKPASAIKPKILLSVEWSHRRSTGCFSSSRDWKGTADASSPLPRRAFEVGTPTYNSPHLNNEARTIQQEKYRQILVCMQSRDEAVAQEKWVCKACNKRGLESRSLFKDVQEGMTVQNLCSNK